MASTASTVFRIALSGFIHDLSGEGASKYGGRWNDKGVPVLYASENRSLAMLEFTVNLFDPQFARDHLSLMEITIPASVRIKSVKLRDLKQGWRAYPHSAQCRAIGGRWAKEKKTAVLKVPSSIILNEFNYVFNPKHPDFKRITFHGARKIVFDKRLLGKK